MEMKSNKKKAKKPNNDDSSDDEPLAMRHSHSNPTFSMQPLQRRMSPGLSQYQNQMEYYRRYPTQPQYQNQSPNYYQPLYQPIVAMQQQQMPYQIQSPNYYQPLYQPIVAIQQQQMPYQIQSPNYHQPLSPKRSMSPQPMSEQMLQNQPQASSSRRFNTRSVHSEKQSVRSIRSTYSTESVKLNDSASRRARSKNQEPIRLSGKIFRDRSRSYEDLLKLQDQKFNDNPRKSFDSSRLMRRNSNKSKSSSRSLNLNSPSGHSPNSPKLKSPKPLKLKDQNSSDDEPLELVKVRKSMNLSRLSLDTNSFKASEFQKSTANYLPKSTKATVKGIPKDEDIEKKPGFFSRLFGKKSKPKVTEKVEAELERSFSFTREYIKVEIPNRRPESLKIVDIDLDSSKRKYKDSLSPRRSMDVKEMGRKSMDVKRKSMDSKSLMRKSLDIRPKISEIKDEFDSVSDIPLGLVKSTITGKSESKTSVAVINGKSHVILKAPEVVLKKSEVKSLVQVVENSRLDPKASQNSNLTNKYYSTVTSLNKNGTENLLLIDNSETKKGDGLRSHTLKRRKSEIKPLLSVNPLISEPKESKKRGFFGRLFGKKDKKEVEVKKVEIPVVRRRSLDPKSLFQEQTKHEKPSRRSHDLPALDRSSITIPRPTLEPIKQEEFIRHSREFTFEFNSLPKLESEAGFGDLIDSYFNNRN